MGRRVTLPPSLPILYQSLRSQTSGRTALSLAAAHVVSPQSGLASWARKLGSHTGAHAQSNAQVLLSCKSWLVFCFFFFTKKMFTNVYSHLNIALS